MWLETRIEILELPMSQWVRLNEWLAIADQPGLTENHPEIHSCSGVDL